MKITVLLLFLTQAFWCTNLSVAGSLDDPCPEAAAEGSSFTLSYIVPTVSWTLAWEIRMPESDDFDEKCICDMWEEEFFCYSDECTATLTETEERFRSEFNFLSINRAFDGAAIRLKVDHNTDAQFGCKLEVYGPQTITCENPQLTKDGENVTVACPVPNNLNGSVCTFYKKSGNSNTEALDSHLVDTRSYCNETCHTQCTLTIPVTSLGPGSHRFKVSISKNGFNETIDSTMTKKIVFEYLVPQIESPCPRGVEGNVVHGYIKEGTTATCDCSLLMDGYPTGRPRWVNSANEEVGATYDGVKTTVSLKYDPNDPTPEYICQGISALGEGETNSTFSPEFAYGPEAVTAEVPTNVSLCPHERHAIEMYCRIDMKTTNPEPKVVVKIEDDFMTPETDFVSLRGDLYFYFKFFPNTSGDIKGVCLATNDVFTEFSVKGDFLIRVFEPPSSPPKVSIANQTISDGQPFHVFIGHPVAVTCDVMGGFPEVSHVKIACENFEVSEFAGTQWAHKITIEGNNIISTTCSCSALHPSGCYNLTTNFTLSVPEAKPEIRFVQVKTTPTSVTLTWTTNDPEYDVFYEIVYDGEKRKRLTTSPMTVDSLHPNKKYTGIVVAHVTTEFFFPRQMEVANITFTTEPDTISCEKPQLTKESKDVTMRCPVPSWFGSFAVCTFYKTSGESNAVALDGHLVKSRSYCEETCHDECTLTIPVTSLGPGRHRFKVSISKDGFNDTVDSMLTEAIDFAYPVPQIESPCPRGVEGNVVDGYIKEGTTATCDCSLLMDGYPTGRPRWVNSANEEVGALYDGDKTTVSLKYDPNDPTPEYVCQGISALGEGETNSTFSPEFAYGPEAVTADVFRNVSLCPHKRHAIEMYCIIDMQTSNPEPKVVLKMEDDLLTLQNEFVNVGEYRYYRFTIFPNKSGDIKGVCLATNGAFTDVSVQDDFRIGVFEPPSSPPKVSIANESIPEGQIFTAFVGHPFPVTCDVTGGFPNVTHVKMACEHFQVFEFAGTRWAHTIALDGNNITSTTCSCSALHPSGCYSLTTNFTLSVPKAKPEIRFLQVNATPTSVTLTWTANNLDYDLFYEIVYDGEKRKILTPSPMTVDGLHSIGKYTGTVVAHITSEYFFPRQMEVANITFLTEKSVYMGNCTKPYQCESNLLCVSNKCQCDVSVRDYYEPSDNVCKQAEYSGPTFQALLAKNRIPIQRGKPLILACGFNLTHSEPFATVTWLYNNYRIRDKKVTDGSAIFESSSTVENVTMSKAAASKEFIYEFLLRVNSLTPALTDSLTLPSNLPTCEYSLYLMNSFPLITSLPQGIYTCKIEGFPEQEGLLMDNMNITNEMLISPEVVLSPSRVYVQEDGGGASLYCYFQDVRRVVFEVNNVMMDRINVTKNTKKAHYYFEPTISPSQVRCIGYFQYSSGGWDDVKVTSNVATVYPYSGPSLTCPENQDGRGTSWTSTPVSSVAYGNCPEGYRGVVMRTCTADGTWEEPNFTNCSKKELLDIEAEVKRFKEVQPSSDLIEDTSARLSKSLNASDHLLSNDISKTVDILSDVSSLISDDESNETLVTTASLENMAAISDLLLSSSEKDWDELEETKMSSDKNGSSSQLIGAKLMVAMETLTVASLKESNFSSDLIIKENIVIQRDVIQSKEDVVFPKQEETVRDKDTINFSASDLTDSDRENLKYSALLFKGIKQIQISQEGRMKGKNVQSNILAFSLNKKLSRTKIQLTFQQIPVENYTDPVCGFLDTGAKQLGTWSTDGCQITELKSGQIDCSCNHLTNFAVLMSLSRPPSDHGKVLGIISIIGCVISILCLTALVITYAALWRHMKKERKLYLHVALSSCLLLVYITFLTGVNRSPHEPDCTFVASLLHYLLLVVFCLMLSEGVEILVAVVFLFAPAFSIWWHFIPVFSLPLLIVSISLGVTGAQDYRSEDVCWLSLSSGTLWAFLAPALAVILANFVILGIVLYVLMNTVTVKGRDKVEKAKLGAKSVGILSPILGLTWIFGILAVDNDTVVFQYLFAICNSFQGVGIFVFYCMLVHQKSYTDQTGLPTTSLDDSVLQDSKHTRGDAYEKLGADETTT